MVSPKEYAAFAYDAYTPHFQNTISVPGGWMLDEQLSRDHRTEPTGFGARVYRNTTTGEVVIAFRGTDNEPLFNIDWLTGNGPAAAGFKSAQVTLAIEVVADVLKSTSPANVHLTGHSLGGGLASIMAVFFDLQAYTWAQAPFDRTIRSQREILDVLWHTELVERYHEEYEAYQKRMERAPETNSQTFKAYSDAHSDSEEAGDTLFNVRRSRITGAYIEGEILTLPRSVFDTYVAGLQSLQVGEVTLDAVGLHSMALHTALYLSPDLRAASVSLPSLLEMASSNDLYARDRRAARVDFTTRILKDAYRPDVALQDSMLGRFAADALRIGGTNRDQRTALIDALVSSTIEFYYYADQADTAPFVSLAGGSNAGVRIDLGRIATLSDKKGRAGLIDGALAAIGGFALPKLRTATSSAAAKARVWTVQNSDLGLNSTGTEHADAMIGSITQANTLSGESGEDLLIGGTAVDVLTGGDHADVIFGSSGNDVISGGTGDDWLFGGNGIDQYNFASNSGLDTVVDTDGGTIFIGSVQFTGSSLIRRTLNTWSSSSGDISVTTSFGGMNRVFIEDRAQSIRISIELVSLSDFGLNLLQTPLPGPGAPGDVIGDTGLGGGGGAQGFSFGSASSGRVRLRFGREGRVRGGAMQRRFAPEPMLLLSETWPPQTVANGSGTSRSYLDMDNLRGTSSANRLFGLSGNDSLEGQDGDDDLDGGDGSDLLGGGLGGDRLMGGAGDDFISGDMHNSQAGSALGGSFGETYEPFGNGYVVQYSGLGWGFEKDASGALLTWGVGGGYFGGAADWIDAGEGADIVFGGDGDDSVTGGMGADYLQGDAGNDLVSGGDDDDVLVGDGQQNVTPGMYNYSFITEGGRDEMYGGAGNDLLIGLGNADALHGDEGDDELFGDGLRNASLPATEYGRDVLDGGGGADLLVGQGGDDILIGGTGADALEGDDETLGGALHGNDSLDGGDDGDTLIGGGGSDQLSGGQGIDQLHGDSDVLDGSFHGSDRLEGGTENDLLIGGGASDQLFGGDGNDDLRGDLGQAVLAGIYQGDDQLDGGLGDDTLIGGGGADSILGGDGADTIIGDANPTVTAVEFHGDDYINAGAGDDQVFGFGGADTIIGGDGADTLVGDDAPLPGAAHGDDSIFGGAGNDLIFGQGGDDVLFGGDGDDELQGDDSALNAPSGSDYLDGGTGNDTLFGRAGNDVLEGSVGNDVLSGGDGNDDLSGGEGADVLDGGEGDDTLHGGEGNDILQGGGGNDTYVFDEMDLQIVGSSVDSIHDTQGENRLVFRSGFVEQAVTLQSGSISGQVIITQGAELGLSVRDALNGSARFYQFADGALVAAHQLIGRAYHSTVNTSSSAANAYLVAGTAADSLTATGQSATLSGGRGNDTLTGGSSSKTTFLVEIGDGADVINDSGAQVIGGVLQTNTLTFGAGIDSGSVQVEYNRSTSRARIRYNNGADSVQLSRFDRTNVTGNFRTLDEIRFADGTTQTWAQFIAAHAIHVLSTSSSVEGTNVGDIIIGTEFAQTLSGGDGNDVLDGRAGNDKLIGDRGNDTYRFAVGGGVDEIENDSFAGDVDRVEVDSAVLSTGVKFYRYNNNLVMRINGTTDQLSITNYFAGEEVDEIRFADGTVYTFGNVPLSSPGEQATEGHDEIFGSPADDVIDGLGGNDTIRGGDGNDTLVQSGGTGSLYGEAGNDILHGGTGGDYLEGGDGDDTLNDSVGDNDLYGLAGNDTLTGSGQLEGGIGNDTLTGAGGSDVLHGDEGADTLSGGGGSDTLDAGSGSDTYVYALGDGDDFIAQFDDSVGKIDTLRFAAGILPARVQFDANAAGDLVITFRDAAGQPVAGSIQIDHYFAFEGPEKVMDRFVFDDEPGTVWTREFVDSFVMAPTSGDDYIRGNSSDEVIDGLAGNDFILGRSGNDVLYGGDGTDRIFGGAGHDELHTGEGGFEEELNGEGGDDVLWAEQSGIFRGGPGSDTYNVSLDWLSTHFIAIDDLDPIDTSLDTLSFVSGTLPSDLLFRANSNHLDISEFDPVWKVWNMRVRVRYFFEPGASNRSVDEFRFADAPGTVLDRSDIEQLMLAGNDSSERLIGFATDDTLTGAGGDDRLEGAAGNDDLDGGAGRDQLEGGDGNDDYHFALGGGYDEIFDSSGTDRLNLGAGIASSQVTLVRTSTPGLLIGTSSSSIDSLAVVLGAGTEQILIEGFYHPNAAIEEIRFADGTTWDAAEIAARVVNQSGTANTAAGTSGNDVFTVNHPGDGITEGAGQGVDQVESSVSYTLPSNVENLTLTGSLALQGTGNSLANVITGNSGSNILRGGSGADTLSGGAGDDTYYVEATEAFGSIVDTVTENAGEGFDTMFVDADGATLSANVERLVVRATISSNTAITRTYAGNALNNVLEVDVNSWSSAVFVVNGGAGADVMTGGWGVHVFIVDDAGDVVWDTGAAGDRIETSVSYALPVPIEDLTLTGSNPISGTGNVFANRMNGRVNTAANALIGGAGDDYYVIGANDTVTESTAEGTDTVEADFTQVLGANVENLRLIGTAAVNGTGNSLNNDLSGRFNSAANTFAGGGGDDTYHLGVGDVAVENAGEGTDTVFADESYALAANVENAQLSGSGTQWLTGNELNNRLTGNGNDNLVIGPAGDDYIDGDFGDDILRGGAGADTYYMTTGGYDDVVQDTDDGQLQDQEVDAIEFADNIDVSQVEFSRSENLLDLVVAVTAVDLDRIWVRNFFAGGSQRDRIEEFRFADGTVLTATDVATLVLGEVVTGTEGPDVLNAPTNGGEMEGLGGDDVLNGSAFSDLLNGGEGADTMLGGLGNDTYRVGNAGDVVTEGAGEGMDTVLSTISFSLPDNVELLSLLGTANINGTGNSSANTIDGNVGNNRLDGGAGADTLTGGAGDDVYVVDADDIVVEGPSGGRDRIEVAFSYQLASNLEDLTLLGTADIDGQGNAADNQIVGNSGANVLHGGDGVDTLVGGAGDDTYHADFTPDVMVENAGGGFDTVFATAGHTLAAHIERLVLVPDTFAFSGAGNDLDNILIGNDAANILDGGSGADRLEGGLGDDTYVVDNAGDEIVELSGAGMDEVSASQSYVLGEFVEHLMLTGSEDLTGTGNALANTLSGNSGANTLDGGGGDDTMQGWAGNDTYFVDAAGDIIFENAGEGTDLTYSLVTFTLGANVENLTLIGAAPINGTGNTLDNVLIGNSASNSLSGGSGHDTLDGGSSNDVMTGGQGNDTYFVDNALDTTVESSGQGTDIVRSTISWTLASNVEQLVLVGTAHIDGTGNSVANVMTGNSGNNTLDGGGGADSMTGGAGDDTYVVNVSGDTVTENPGEGIDTVRSSIAYTLGSGVENLTLTGTGSISGTGNTLDNVLIGNSVANTLNGGGGNDWLDGGAGNDTMAGGAGDDVYIVAQTSDVTNESAGAGLDRIESSIARTLANEIEILFLTGTDAINGTGNGLNNLLRGNTANNTLAGAAGVDILEGGVGTDTLSDTGGNTLLNGGDGTDTLTGTTSKDLLIGGIGNDALTTGSGADLIAFNLGDGQDTVAVSTTKDNVVSIGGGALYADLLFQKTGTDLILRVGADQIRFTGYYAAAANRSVDKLQVIIEGTTDYDAGSSNATRNAKIQTFDFGGLVSAFDAALAANPGLTSWALTNALTAQHLGGSNTAAIGGDLAYRYGRFNTLSDISFTPAVGILAASGFATAAQTLQSLSSLQDTSPRLS